MHIYKIIDFTLRGVACEKTMFIISDKCDEVHEKVIKDINRGGTVFAGEGLYSGSKRKMIYTNVSRREYQILKVYIRKIDPNAFVTVLDANEIFGNDCRQKVRYPNPARFSAGRIRQCI